MAHTEINMFWYITCEGKNFIAYTERGIMFSSRASKRRFSTKDSAEKVVEILKDAGFNAELHEEHPRFEIVEDKPGKWKIFDNRRKENIPGFTGIKKIAERKANKLNLVEREYEENNR